MPLVLPDTYLRRFDWYPLEEGQSLASLLSGGVLSGIYVYRFSDNTWYVGKTVNLISRHSQHCHDYRHDRDYSGVRITDVWFMPVDKRLGDARLDEEETLAIKRADSCGYSLRNKMKTKSPRGTETARIELADKSVIEIPWEREHITQGLCTRAACISGTSDNNSTKAHRLIGSSPYKELRSVLGKYLRETIPEARATAGRVWAISALPSTAGGGRLLTLSISVLETIFVVGSVSKGIEAIVVNMKKPRGYHGFGWLPRTGFLYRASSYKACENVYSLELSGADDLADSLARSKCLDWCYGLNCELMRRSPTFHTRAHSAVLAEDLLNAAGL